MVRAGAVGAPAPPPLRTFGLPCPMGGMGTRDAEIDEHASERARVPLTAFSTPSPIKCSSLGKVSK